MNNKTEGFQKLLEIMDNLRQKCPWDRKQTFESLRHLTIEETYELSEAILANDPEGIKKELGDLMLHIVFYAKIGEERGEFDISNVLHEINTKLIRRHPHIYGDVVAKDARSVRDNWEKIKLTEEKRSVLSGVPASLPSLIKAFRMQEKASGVGFDWPHREQVWEKVIEELNELQDELSADMDVAGIENEFGDLLFSLVNCSRFWGINPEDALEKSNRKFIRRFNRLEAKVEEMGKTLQKMPLEEMEQIWEEVKKEEIIT